ncbi:MAG: TIGR02391 family protein [Lachnospiraceae bacterium]|nr:TIGR02391 family protein [Lachnospiraceae bacterium]
MNINEVIKIKNNLEYYMNIPNIFSGPLPTLYFANIQNSLTELNDVEENYPLLFNRYSSARKALFITFQDGKKGLNPIVFGQIITIIDLIISEDHEPSEWQCIHPLIKKSSMKLFLNEHYTNAAEDAFIEIVDRTKKLYLSRSQSRDECDGVDLMNKLFSLNNPLVIFDDFDTETGKNIQKGFHFMFAGAISALRNPKAHSNTIVLDARESMRRIMFASMLMYKLDEIEN